MIPPSRAGRHCAARGVGVILLLAGILVALLAGAAPGQTSGAGVEVVEIEGVIDRTVAEYLQERVAAAADRNAEVLVISLDTPGGLGADVEQLTQAVVDSDVPVAVWVGPSGARAAGAGLQLAYAAHVLAVAPSTTLGPARPVDLGAPGADDAAEVEARLAQLGSLRGRDDDFVREAVHDEAVVAVGRADTLPADARLPAGVSPEDVTVVAEDDLDERPVADLVAPALPDVLTALDGRTVELAGGAAATLAIDQATATVRFNNMGLVRRTLHTVANPTLAYLLLVAGALSLLFEVFQPGFGVAGVTGIAVMALGVYGLAMLPVSWFAFALILVGLALLAVDLAIAGLGVPTVTGTVALTAGSLLLFRGAEALRVSPWVIGAVVAFTVVFFVFIMTTVLRAQGHQALAGAEGLAGKVGVVRSMLNPEGHIFVAGALWRARAPESAGKVRTGTKVRVLGINDRLTLDVEVIDSDESQREPVG